MRKTLLSKFLRLLLLGLIFLAVARFCHHQTKGFSLEKIRNNTSSLAGQVSLPPLPEQTTLLRQKFTYLGRGLQSYCFLSEDKKTVLKLFNNRYQQKLFWLQHIPSTGPLKKWKKEKIAYYKKKLQKTFESYQLAYDFLKKETALLYFHPQKSHFPFPTLRLLDNLGIEHRIPLHHVAFALQKKATSAYTYLHECAQKKDWIKARYAIYGLLQLLQRKMDLGIADSDSLIRTNFGFFQDTPMQMDIGSLFLDSTLKNREKQQEELKSISLSLKHWLENNHPPMALFLHEALQNL